MFTYDVNGRVAYVDIADGSPRDVTFVTDAQGQVLNRRVDNRDGNATNDPQGSVSSNAPTGKV